MKTIDKNGIRNYFTDSLVNLWNRLDVNAKINFKQTFENETGFYFRYWLANLSQQEYFVQRIKDFL